MQVPPEIVARNVEITPYIDGLITKGISKLEHVCDYIISVHIALEQQQGRHQTGNPYRMRITLRIPDRADVVVERSSRSPLPGHSPLRKSGDREEPLTALIRKGFDSAIRQMEKAVDKQRGYVKTNAQLPVQAVVEKLFPDQDYGFLRTLDGEQVYFHRNSVLHKHWERLTAGTLVRYTPEMGEKGLQASTVEVLARPGIAEAHDNLHELPTVAQTGKSRK